MKKVLLTGFEPFGGRDINPSYEAVMLAKETDGIKIKKARLPVSWTRAPKALFREIDDFDPDAVIMCGLASGSAGIRIERVGINICGAVKDNDGKYPSETFPFERKICDDGANAYFSTFDHARIIEALKAENIPAAYSFCAGTYICNLVLYSALKKNFDEKTDRKIGFLHIPDADGQVSPNAASMRLDVAANAAMAAVRCCF